MRKPLFFLTIILAVILLIPGISYADSGFVAERIQDVKIRYADAKIIVEWRVKAVPDKWYSIHTDTIEIYKAVKDTDKFISDYDFKQVHKVNINNYVNEEGYHTLTWEDTNVPLDKKYQYEVTCGSLAVKKGKSQVLTVKSESTAEEDNSDIKSRQESYEESADWPERLAASIILAPAKFIIDVIGLQDPVQLIFQAKIDDGADALKPTDIIVDDNGNVTIEEDADNLHFRTFDNNEFRAINDYFGKLSELVPISLVVIVVLIALGVFYISTNPNSQISFKDYLIGLLLGLFVLKVGVYILSIVFEINYAIVKFFQMIVGDKLSSSYLDTIININGLTLGSAILTCIGAFSIGILNWQYVVRKIVLGILIGILPLVAIISIMPSKRNVMGYWLKEFFSQVFLQSSHAAVLSLALLFMSVQTGFWIQLAVLLGLPMMSKLVREVFGAESPASGMVGGVGAMMGLSALYSLGRMIKSKSGLKSKTADGISNIAETTGQATQNVATGSSRNIMQSMARGGLKTAGRLTAGMMGGMLSATLTGNPVTGFAGAIGGASIGASIGDRIANTAETTSGLFTMSQEEKNKAMGIGNSVQLDDPAQAYQAGKNLYGGGVIGTVAGTTMAAKSSFRAITGKGDYQTAKQIKNITQNNAKQLNQARQNLASYQPIYEKTKAELNRARSLYSPNSSYLAGLTEKSKMLGDQKNRAEQEYLEAINDWNNNYLPEVETGIWTSEAHEAYNRLQSAKNNFNTISSELDQVGVEIDTSKKYLSDKKREFERVEAEYNSRKAEVSHLEYKVSNEGIQHEYLKINPKLRNNFHSIKQPPQQTGGGINISWR